MISHSLVWLSSTTMRYNNTCMNQYNRLHVHWQSPIIYYSVLTLTVKGFFLSLSANCRIRSSAYIYLSTLLSCIRIQIFQSLLISSAQKTISEL
ncbi:hypothetical protein BJ912DRAFT_987329 [Pholiota molesta]|nr:hypothetical protein BJ912DRAFT_987329 [Pholiota molesta]